MTRNNKAAPQEAGNGLCTAGTRCKGTTKNWCEQAIDLQKSPANAIAALVVEMLADGRAVAFKANTMTSEEAADIVRKCIPEVAVYAWSDGEDAVAVMPLTRKATSGGKDTELGWMHDTIGLRLPIAFEPCATPPPTDKGEATAVDGHAIDPATRRTESGHIFTWEQAQAAIEDAEAPANERQPEAHITTAMGKFILEQINPTAVDKKQQAEDWFIEMMMNMSDDEPLELPIDGLPYEMQTAIEVVSNAKRAPRDYVAAGMVTVAGTAMGNRVVCQQAEYTNHPNLYTVMVGDPSAQKSPAYNWCVAPLAAVSKRWLDESKAQRREWERKRKTQPDFDEPEPGLRKVIMTDFTPEAVFDVLNVNKSVGLYDEELGVFFDNIERYNRNGFARRLCTTYTYGQWDRTTRHESDILEYGCCASLFGGIPDDELPSYFGGAALRSGLTSRIAFVLAEKANRPDEFTLIPESINNWWRDTIEYLVRMPAGTTVIEPEDVRLAREQIYGFYEREQERFEAKGEKKKASQIMKLHIIVCRLCIIFAVMHGRFTITLDDLKLAFRWASYFKRTFAMMLDKIQGKGNHQRLTVPQLVYELNQRKPFSNKSKAAEGLGIDRGNLTNWCNGKF